MACMTGSANARTVFFCVHLCDAEQSTFAGAFLPDIGFTRRKCGVQHRDIVGFFILEHEIKRIRINNGVLNFLLPGELR